MKRIYLVRHGKSAWDTATLHDHDRPILPKGEWKTRMIAEYLIKQQLIPACIISSTAARAAATARILTQILGIDPSMLFFDKRLYDCAATTCYDVLIELADQIPSVMLVGHNPGISEFASLLAKSPVTVFPTSAVMGIDADLETWTDVPLCAAQKLFFVTPSMLKK